MKTITVSTRLNADEARAIASIASDAGLDRSAFLRQLIRKGFGDVRLDRALDLYRQRKVTLSRAAELAGLSVRDLLARLPDAGIELNHDLAELRRDLETA